MTTGRTGYSVKSVNKKGNNRITIFGFEKNGNYVFQEDNASLYRSRLLLVPINKKIYKHYIMDSSVYR